VTIRGRLRAAMHGWTDDVVAGLVGRPRLFGDGWGDRHVLARLVARVEGYAPREPVPITMRWDGAWQSASIGFERSSSFVSPAAEILPRGTHDVVLHWHSPRRDLDGVPTVLLLAATGEEGFGLRRRLAASLVARGVAAVMLENPFYGRRRPPGQMLALLRTVADQFAMNTATVDEAHAVVGHMRELGCSRIGVSGYSQGGMMAVFTAALTTTPIAAIPRAAGAAAGSIFTEDALARRFAWDRLRDGFVDEAGARRFFAECLAPVDARRFPPPVAANAAILLAPRHDRFVRAADVLALHRHWPGAELRWLEAGHLTGALMHGPAHTDAIVDALDRLA
jgi:hypothetical protein